MRVNLEMKMQMKPHIVNYLMSCAPASADGALKAQSHEALVTIFVNHEGGDEDRIRQTTRQLTEHLEELINFPRWGVPDYRRLWGKFYDKFIEYART